MKAIATVGSSNATTQRVAMNAVVALLGLCAACGAASAVDDALRPLQDWTPPGWKEIRRAAGDLDRDGDRDIVLVLEQDAPAPISADGEEDGDEVLNTNPRMLLVLFAEGGMYRKAAENTTLVPTERSVEEPCLDDPLTEVAIRNGTLRLTFERFLSCGGWATSKVVYTFRHDGKGMRLIGQDTSTFMRNSGEETMDSINYLTGRQKIVNGMYEAGENGLERDLTPRWRPLARTAPRYLESLLAPELE